MRMDNKIAVSGDLGSGKTTVSIMIADKLNYKRYSTGDIQRKLASENNMSTLEFNKVSETNDYIDKLIDGTTAQMAESEESIVFDSRMAWHFVPNSFSVRLIINSLVGAERIMNAERGAIEKYSDIEEAIQKVRERKMSEKKRFSTKYGVDLSDLSNYNLVIDTSYATAEEVASLILNKYHLWKEGKSFQKIWFSPKNLFPTQSIRDISPDKIKAIQASFKDNGYIEDSTIEIIKLEESEFVIKGHHRVGAAILTNIKYLQVKVILKNSPQLIEGVSLEQIYDWEDCFGFKFKIYPDFVKEKHSG
jgi:cytidylate kinase